MNGVNILPGIFAHKSLPNDAARQFGERKPPECGGKGSNDGEICAVVLEKVKSDEGKHHPGRRGERGNYVKQEDADQEN